MQDFIVTRRGMNNGEDFPREMLTEVYNNIQDREIILPSEHSGAVKESYEWKVCHARVLFECLLLQREGERGRETETDRQRKKESEQDCFGYMLLKSW